MTLIVRSANGGPAGIDWRAVAALIGVVVVLGTLTVGMMQERITVLAHVARGEEMILPVQRHIDNIGEYQHLDQDVAKMVAALPLLLDEIRDDLTVIKRKLKITDDELRIGDAP